MQITQQAYPQITLATFYFIKSEIKAKWISLVVSITSFINIQWIIYQIKSNTSIIQQISLSDGNQGQDTISVWQVWQICVQMPIIQQSTWKVIISNQGQYHRQINCQLIITFWSYSVFMVTDLQLFYISFEGVQIPMYILIGFYGGRNRKIHAANQFFIYTLQGSQFLQQGQVIQYQETGTSNYQILATINISSTNQLFIQQAFFFAQAIKIPMVPMHIWLPEAHVEAPTAASVLQAAILQKQGSYGLLRYCQPFFPQATKFLSPFIITQCIIGIIYSSIACQAIWDMKKLIAYSSIAHMNTATQALFTNDLNGLNACVFFMISHGIISSAQFLIIGFIYDRYHTRTIKYYKGLALIKPMLISFFLIFTLANIAVPGTSGFVCEFMTFLAAFQSSPVAGLLSTSAIILAPAYSLWFFHKISYGTISPHFYSLWSDQNRKEFYLLLPLAIFTIYMGLYPDFILSTIQFSCLGLQYDISY